MGRKTKPEPLPKNHQVVADTKATRAQGFRPAEHLMTVEEAKHALRQRYESQGYEVLRVNRYDKDWFTVSFREGQGPMKLSSVLCNWPYRDGALTRDEAMGVRKIDMKAIMADPKLKKMMLDKGIEFVVAFLKEKK